MRTLMKRVSPLLFFLLITACATPRTLLKNDAGQVVECGGQRSGSAMFGVIGYKVQKSDAEKCVQEYEKAGFKKIE